MRTALLILRLATVASIVLVTPLKADPNGAGRVGSSDDFENASGCEPQSKGYRGSAGRNFDDSADDYVRGARRSDRRGMMRDNRYDPEMLGDDRNRCAMRSSGCNNQMFDAEENGRGMMHEKSYRRRNSAGNDSKETFKSDRSLSLTTDDVKSRMERWLARQDNPRLKLGEVKEIDAESISADVITKDNSLVDRWVFDRRTGASHTDKEG